MSFCIKIIDQVPGTATVERPHLTFRVGQVTAREIVSARVRLEVDRHNSELEPRAHLEFIETSKEELALNTPRQTRPRHLNLESQIDIAFDAIRRGRVIILFNGEQVSDLDAPLVVTPVSEARFLRLMPLVGG